MDRVVTWDIEIDGKDWSGRLLAGISPSWGVRDVDQVQRGGGGVQEPGEGGCGRPLAGDHLLNQDGHIGARSCQELLRAVRVAFQLLCSPHAYVDVDGASGGRGYWGKWRQWGGGERRGREAERGDKDTQQGTHPEEIELGQSGGRWNIQQTLSCMLLRTSNHCAFLVIPCELDYQS